jgi:hypothetical protein
MPVRLDKVPAPALRPSRPRIWLWLGLLPLFLLIGVAAGVLSSTQSLDQQPPSFWEMVLGAPLAIWGVLGFARLAGYIGQQSVADGWDEARQEDLTRRLRRGRRSQQVLGVSLYTGLREPDVQPAAQLDSLLNAAKAIKSQPCWQGETTLHSRLPVSGDKGVEPMLCRMLARVLGDIGQILAQFPHDKPITLLLDIDSPLQGNELRSLWKKAWCDSGIRQSCEFIDGAGLSAVDQWLDQRIADNTLLMVVALQIAPAQPTGTAEAAVGLLFGNRLTQTTLPPLAYLHRPEQARELDTESLLYATRQALDWVPLEAKSIEQIWQVGIDRQRDASISTVLTDVAISSKPKQGLCDLDALLGHPGHVSPWLAIAAATQNLQRGTGPQFIFSGVPSVEAGLWCTVMTPVPPLSR